MSVHSLFLMETESPDSAVFSAAKEPGASPGNLGFAIRGFLPRDSRAERHPRSPLWPWRPTRPWRLTGAVHALGPTFTTLLPHGPGVSGPKPDNIQPATRASKDQPSSVVLAWFKRNHISIQTLWNLPCSCPFFNSVLRPALVIGDEKFLFLLLRLSVALTAVGLHASQTEATESGCPSLLVPASSSAKLLSVPAA